MTSPSVPQPAVSLAESAAPATPVLVRTPPRRLWPWACAAAAAALVLAGLAPWAISRDALREEIAGQLRSTTGLYVFSRGPASLSLLPRPRVTFEDAAFVDPTGAMVIEARALVGAVRVLPLLAGRLEVADIALEAPKLTVDVDRRPLTAAGPAVRAAAAPAGTPQASKADLARIGVVTIVGGSAELRRGGAAFAHLEQIDARLDWRTVGSAAGLTLAFDWGGQRHQMSAWVAEPAKLLRGAVSMTTVNLANADSNLMSAGLASLAPRPIFNGRVRLATRAAPALLSAIGIDVPLPSVMSTFVVDGDGVASPGALSLTNARLSVGGDDFEGSIGLAATEARPVLTGTLATRSMTLTPWLANMPSLFGPDGRFSSDPFEAVANDAPDLDLRLSAQRLRLDRVVAQDAAFSLLSRNGRHELSVAEAQAWGGVVKGKIVAALGEAPGTRAFKATLALAGIDWSALDRDASGEARMSGIGDLTLTAQGVGDSPLRIARDLRGEARATLAGGDIGGLDLAGTLARIERRPLAAASDLNSGRTPFDRAALTLRIDQGVGALENCRVEGPGYAMTLEGAVQIPEARTALTAAVTRAGDDARPGFAFEAAGPWTRPVVMPDVRGLMRRSDAASPLFAGSSR